MKRIVALCAVLAISGCAVAPLQGEVVARQQALSDYAPAQAESLFSSDAAVLSDADIKRILEFRYVPPAKVRLAVLPLGQERWFGFSDELARSGENMRSELVARLARAPNVTSAAFIPSLLVPRSRTVAYFREAAARYQSELLLIYQASCQTYEKFRFFQANQSKSYCSVEAVLLDVRTGIVPFTTSVTEEFRVTQESSDSSIYETRRRAELTAVSRALARVADQTVAYLSGQSR